VKKTAGWGIDARLAHLAAAPSRAARPSRQHVDALFDPVLPLLSDEQRSLALFAFSSVLRGLVDDLAASAVRPDLDLEPVIAALEADRTLRKPEVASAVIHRAEEHRLGRRLRAGAYGTEQVDAADGSLLDGLIASEDDTLSTPAIAYQDIMRSRLNREGAPQLHAEELPPPLANILCWTAAAALARSDEPARLPLWSLTAKRLNARRDVSDSAQHRAMRLAARLQERGEIDALLLRRLIAAGDPLMLTAVVAAKASISLGTAWSLLFRVQIDATLALLTAMKLPQTQIAAIARQLFAATAREAVQEDVAEAAIAIEDLLSNRGSEDLLSYWRIDPAMRTAMDVSASE
jgi:hypothetical protein|tara:strand:- start:25581 stop:26624 length:1044 start_codon:yes stop_codon:yes gene_type:complete